MSKLLPQAARGARSAPFNAPNICLQVEPLEDRILLSNLSLLAAGTTNQEQIELLIDDQVVASWDNLGGDAYAGQFVELTYSTAQNISADQVRIQFVNDLYDPANNIDRNVRIDALIIDGNRFETESPQVFSTGTWKPEDGIVPGFRESEFLHTDGYFQYDSGNSNTGSLIQLRARGQQGGEQFNLQIDNTTVATFVATTDFATFAFTAADNVEAGQVRVVFTNDRWDPANNIDLNLIVDRLVVDGQVFETEDPTVFSTGTWKPEDGITPGFRESEFLHTNGYFQYQSANQNLPGMFQRDGHLYILTEQSVSWAAAQSEAESLGGNLATINDAAEEAWLRQTFGDTERFWIGLNDRTDEGQFVWASGESSSYLNWANGEPDSNNASAEDGVVMNVGASQQWATAPVTSTQFGIIEIGIDDQPAETPGLFAEYYNDLALGNLAFTRIDSNINFDWGNGSPASSIGNDTFSVRWTGEIIPRFSETYTFRTLSDDGVRLWIDNQLIIDEWNDHAPTFHTGSLALQSNQRYDIRLEYYENRGNSTMELEWSSNSQTREAVPQSRLVAPLDTAIPNGDGFSTEEIASGLVQPVNYAVAPDGRIFVAEKAGRVQIVENGQVISTFLDINEEVQSGHDRGLLGIALDPDFETNGHVYLNFSEEIDFSNPDNAASNSPSLGRLIRISASASNPNVADLASRVDVLTGHRTTHFTHSVGDVEFDNDGNLIFTWGDGGFDPVLRLESQDPDSKQGKLFRVDPDTFEGVPGNPFYDPSNPDSVRSKVWALGVRNSWKVSVDRATGDVYMGEVTDGGPEEINVIRADGSSILNLGWPYFEDNIPTNHATPPPNFEYERAFIALPHTNAGGGDAVVGGDVFRGNAYPDVYDGRFFFGNFNQGILYTASADGAYQQFGTAGQFAGVVDIQLGPDNHIWYMSIFSGKIFRVVSAEQGSSNTRPVAIANATFTAGVGDLTTQLSASNSFDADGDSLFYAWDVNSDGSIDATGEVINQVFTTPGRTTATLIVSDGKGGTATSVLEFDVLATAPPGNNLALGRPTIQSGVQAGGLGSRAVDGNIDGDFFNQSVSMSVRTRTPLWEVDLGAIYDLDDIEIFNRTDQFGDRLNNFWILVSDNPFSSGNLDAARNDPGVVAIYEAGTAGALASYQLQTAGRYVRIQLADVDTTLSLAEVRINGQSADNSVAGSLTPNAPVSSLGPWAATGDGVIIAMIDTGVDFANQRLASRLWRNSAEIFGDGIDNDNNGFVDDRFGYDFIDNDGVAQDRHGHGTFMASLLAATPGDDQLFGVAPDAQLMMLKAFGDNGLADPAAIADAIRYAVDNGAQIINLPFAGDWNADVASAIEYARANQVLIVTAAGNDGSPVPAWPSRMSVQSDNVLSVGASSVDGVSLPESNRVGNSGAVQIDAAGAGFGYQIGGAVTTMQGTSVATTYASGAAALALSLNPELTAAQLRDVLTSTAGQRPSGSDSLGYLDVAAAIERAEQHRQFEWTQVDGNSVLSLSNLDDRVPRRLGYQPADHQWH